jgi:hypothetical protein
MKSEVLALVKMWVVVFWVVTQCNLVVVPMFWRNINLAQDRDQCGGLL